MVRPSAALRERDLETTRAILIRLEDWIKPRMEKTVLEVPTEHADLVVGPREERAPTARPREPLPMPHPLNTISLMGKEILLRRASVMAT